MKVVKSFLLVLCFLLMNSCYEELDFSQANNIVLKPVYTVSVTNFSLVPGQFFNSLGVQETEIEDISEFRIFEENVVRNNVVKIDFNAVIKNEFDRAVTINIDFLNENNGLVYRFSPIQVQSGNLNYTYSEEIDVANNPNILNTYKVSIKAELENTGSQMNPNSTEKFEFKSAVTVYIESDI